MIRNIFHIYGDRVSIGHPDWNFVASASIKDEYADELQRVTWSKNGPYLYSSVLSEYLHVSIILKFDKLRHFLCFKSMNNHDSTFIIKHKSSYELFYNNDDLVCNSC